MQAAFRVRRRLWTVRQPYRAARTSSRLGPVLDLEHFLQRARVLALYRIIVRSTAKIRDPVKRQETKLFARQEIEKHRHVTDITHIRYLISTGKTEWSNMERYIDGL